MIHCTNDLFSSLFWVPGLSKQEQKPLYVFSTRTSIYKYFNYTFILHQYTKYIFIWYVFAIFQTSILYNTLLYERQLTMLSMIHHKSLTDCCLCHYSEAVLHLIKFSNQASPSDTAALHLLLKDTSLTTGGSARLTGAFSVEQRNMESLYTECIILCF